MERFISVQFLLFCILLTLFIIMLDLSYKVALVIGLGQTGPEGWGIGAACAVTLARQGAIIFGGNRTIASTTKIKPTDHDTITPYVENIRVEIRLTFR